MFKDKNYIEIASMDELTKTALQKVVKYHAMQQKPRLEKLMKYYKGQNTEIMRKPRTTDKPDNRIANPYAREIVDMITGVFISNPIRYSSDDKEALLNLQVVNELNEEHYHNMTLAKHVSIYSIGAEVMFLDENAEIRFAVVDPTTVIPVYSTGIVRDLIGAIRYYTVEDIEDSKDDKKYIEVYRKECTLTYQDVNGAIKLIDEQPNYFGRPALNVYYSGEEEISDIEPVLSLIDSYDRLMSETDNLYSYFADAYLVFSGVDMLDMEEVKNMKENRIIMMENEQSSVQFLTKQTDSASLKDHFDRIKNNIYKFSYCIPIDETVFGNDVSGTALKYRLTQILQLTTARERMFTQAINKRIEMIFKVLGIKGKQLDPTIIKQTYTPNIPANDTELVNIASALTGIVSKETILGILPMVEDIEEELKRIEEENAMDNALIDPYRGIEMGVPEEEDNEIPPKE